MGIKERRVFNCLHSFHCIGQTPFDLMHDWLEKVAPTDCHAIIMAFNNSGQFTLQDYNQALTNIKLESYELGNRPCPVRLMPVVICSIADLD